MKNEESHPAPAAAQKKITVSAMSEEELVALFKRFGEPAFRASQVREFIYRKGVSSYDEITNISKVLRQELAREAPLYELEPVETSEGDDATKWLWKASDGALIESVQISTPDRVTT